MAENVRLVVWDLDETFWRGTLSEGPIEQITAHHEMVVELARRGIVNSICSKNDFAAVQAMGLRPASVLLIDDNPMNLREAVHV